MSPFDFVFLLVIAGLCGAAGRALAGDRGGGCLLSVILGFVGALLGSWIARGLELPAVIPIDLGDGAFPVVWAVIGAALFMVVLGFLSPGSEGQAA